MSDGWSRTLLILIGALLAGVHTAKAGVCSGQPDGMTCDVGVDQAYTMICVADACVPCTADFSAPVQFVDNGNGTITDRHTCLVWEKKDNAGGIHDLNNVYQWSSSGSAMDGSAFTVFLVGPTGLNSTAFAGHQDWRVPTAAGKSPPTGQPAEAESIDTNVSCGPTAGACVPAAFNTNCGPYGPDDPPATTTSNPGCTIDGAGGTSMCSCAPFYHSWTASSVGGSPAEAWLECYTVPANGLSAPSKTDTYNVRAVRGGAAPSSVCAPAPLASCLVPDRSTLLLTSNAADHRRDRIAWSWKKSGMVAGIDLGDPTATTEYVVCIYTANGLLLEMSAQPGTSWQALGSNPPSGYRYADSAGTHDGITSARMTSGTTSATRASVISRGVHTPFVGLPLTPAQLPLTVQLVNSNATPQCWTANFVAPPTKNGSSRFKVSLP